MKKSTTPKSAKKKVTAKVAAKSARKSPSRLPTTAARKTTTKKTAKTSHKSPTKKTKKMSTPPVPKPAASTGAPTLHAMIIGCDLYLPNTLPEGSYPSLGGCVRDAMRVKDFLTERAGLQEPNLILLTSSAGTDGKPIEPADRRPTYKNIVEGFQKLIDRAKSRDHVYVHFSGHGGRCPTIIPKVKGLQANDEALVPIDIGDKSSRYVRDIEIAALLKKMADKKIVATIVFDCCHSGGATRAVRRDHDSTGIRGVGFVDSAKRPTDSLVGTVEELSAAAELSDGITNTGQTRGVNATSNPPSALAFLAACRPFELAREYAFDGGPRQGALTYWYLKLIEAGIEGLTFRTIFDQVVKRIHDQFPDQTPMFFGDPDRAILGGMSIATLPAIPVIAASAASITLGAGQASLIEAGTEYAIFPQAAKDLTVVNDRVAAVRVTTVRPNEANAEVVQLFQSRGIRVGDKAVPIGVPLKLVRKIDVLTPNGTAPGPQDLALQAIRKNLSNQTWVEQVATAGDSADFVVTTDKKGTTYQICDASDVPLQIRPPLLTTEPTAAKQVVARLIHLARFQAVQALDNPDPASPLRGLIVTELLRTPPTFQLGQSTTGFKPYEAGVVPRLKPGEWVVLSVSNRSAFPVNLTILDLTSDWSVSIVDQDGQRSFPLASGGPAFHLPLQAWIPDDQVQVNDVLKVIATVDPPPAFDVLTLPALDHSIPRSGERGGTTRSAGPLATLLAAAGSDRPPTRAVSTGGVPTRGWSVTQVKIEVG